MQGQTLHRGNLRSVHMETWRKTRAQRSALPDHIVLSAPLNQRRETQQLHQRTANPLVGDFRLMPRSDFVESLMMVIARLGASSPAFFENCS